MYRVFFSSGSLGNQLGSKKNDPARKSYRSLLNVNGYPLNCHSPNKQRIEVQGEELHRGGQVLIVVNGRFSPLKSLFSITGKVADNHINVFTTE